MKKDTKSTSIIVGASIVLLYAISFGPLEALACKLYPSKLSSLYFDFSSRFNYPHYKMATRSELYFKYYTYCYKLGAGEPFRYSYASYKENMTIGTCPSDVSMHRSRATLKKVKVIKLPDPDWGRFEDFAAFSDSLLEGMTREEVLGKISGRPYKDFPDDNSIICEWKSRTESRGDGDSATLTLSFDEKKVLIKKSFVGEATSDYTSIMSF